MKNAKNATYTELCDFIASQLARAAGSETARLDLQERFVRLGLTSLGATRLMAALSGHLGRPLSPTLVWEHPTIAALAAHLCGEPGAAAAPPPAAPPHEAREPIAIVGLACRFPGAPDVPSFWRLLAGGVDAITEVPADRWDAAALYDADTAAPGKLNTRWGGFIDGVDRFEPQFFGISPREAMHMDPRQRLALELAWEALTDAGLAPAALRGSRTGVFLGTLFADHALLQDRAGPRAITAHTSTGGASCIVANRVSYVLGLQGPSLAVDTACSSSLVAVHLACQSLRGESDLALAGGVSVMLVPETTMGFTRLNAMSPDGRCRSFDARANGYVRSEGAGLLVLKRLSAAVRDGDRVYAVLRGSAVNNDGASNGLTAPSPLAQQAVLRDACRAAGVAPADIHYVEAHGSATPLGDPIEAGALGAVLGAARSEEEPLYIGSVKSNIGHLEAAAGIAGLMKVALALHHDQLPPSLHFETPNPNIDFAGLRLRVVSRPTSWPAPAGAPRRAGVSSFGYGGTNAHAILESVPPVEAAPRRLAGAAAEGGRRVVAVFSGQGSQWPGMGRALALSAPPFRAALVACDEALAPHLGWSVLAEVLAGSPRAVPERIDVTWPVLFAYQVALAALLRAHGVAFAAVLGHSIGEVAAAHVAGALSLPDAALVIAAQARLVQRAAGQGRMLLAGLDWEAAQSLAQAAAGRVHCAIAASPQTTVLTGEDAALAELEARLAAGGVFVRAIQTSAAVHGPQVAYLRDELPPLLAGLRPGPAQLPLVSSLLGAAVRGEQLDAGYWARQLCEPVRFAAGVKALLGGGPALWLEVAPHPIVKVSIEECLRHAGEEAAHVVLAAAWRGEDEGRSARAAAAAAAHQAERAPDPVPLAGAAADVDPPAPLYALPLSAHSEAALREGALRLAERLHTVDDSDLPDVCYTASRRRPHLPVRGVAVGRSRAELVAGLTALAASAAGGDAAPDRAPGVVFVFPGQGSQWLGMARGLLGEEPVFREAVLTCDGAIAAEGGFSLLEEIAAGEERSQRSDIGVVQPVLFAIQVALAALWRSWGIVPAGVVGHSMGEVAAAHVAGMLSLADAVRVICRRSRLLRGVRGRGAMGLVELSLAEAEAAIGGHGDRLSVAASNGPRATVLSGDPAALDEVLSALQAGGVFCRRVQVDVASHSPQMDPLLAELRAQLGELRPGPGHTALWSTVTGARLDGAALGAGYWADNLRAPVRFHGALRACIADGLTTFLELSPHPLLLPSVDETLREAGRAGAALASLRRHADERRAMLESLGALWQRGAAVAWDALYPSGSVVSLPGYPWQRQRYALDMAALPAERSGEASGHPLLGARLPVAGTGAVFEALLDAAHPAWLAEHRVAGQVLLPGTALAEWVHAAGWAHLGGPGARVTGLALSEPLVLSGAAARRVQVVLAAEREGLVATVYSQPADGPAEAPWTVHARGAVAEARPPAGAAALDLAALRGRCPEALAVTALYERLAERGYDYGPAFQAMRALWRGDREALVEIAAPTATGEGYAVHPALLDAAFQAAIVLAEDDAGLLLPFSIEELAVHLPGTPIAWAHVRLGGGSDDGQLLAADLTLVGADGAVVAEIAGLRLKRAAAGALSAPERTAPPALVQLTFCEAPLPRAPSTGGTGAFLLMAAAESSLGQALAARLPGCVRVAPGDAAALAERARRPGLAGVLCLWEARTGEVPAAAALRLATEGLAVAQALRDAAGVRLLWATSGAVGATAGDAVSPELAVLWGLGRTVQQEQPELGCTLIDLEAGDGAAAAALLREAAATDGEDQIAYRGGRRLAARLVRAADAVPGPLPLPAQGTVLITGGLGALGLRAARWLAERGVAHLLLTGRRGPLAPQADEAVAALRQLGAAVTVAAVDVADREALAAALSAIPAQWPLRGIVHAAGVLEDGVLAEQTSERFARVLRPKVDGAWHLHELTRGQPLDLFLLFSSIIGTLGGGGQGSYAAANAFLDGLAAHRRALGLPAQSLAWGPWAEVGMAAGIGAVHQARMARQGLGPLAPAAGVAALARVLGRPEAHLGVVSLDLRAAARFHGAAVPPLWRALLRPAAPREAAAGSWAERLAELPPEQRLEELRAAVRSDTARALSLGAPGAVPLDRPFREFGLDSLMALELRNALGRRLGATLPATLAFDYPTVDALARWLMERTAGEPKAAAAPGAAAERPATGDEPIAVIGIGCRYPGGVSDAASFWALLDQGLDAVAEVPRERWDVDALYDPDPEARGKMTARTGAFLPDIDRFDAGFFGIAAREAVAMDPQQRLLLETTWEALEAAALSPDRLLGSDTGVFVGLMYQEYAGLTGGLEAIDGYAVTGSAASVASGRISYVLGLKGPSLTVDTACSSSLVAVHLACQALRSGECATALAGGITLMLTPTIFVEFSRLRGLAPDGRCKSFSAAADGTGWGEGCGVVVLKRLSDAQRDGDRVLALLRGSVVNQDGRSNGLTAPNGPSQEAVLRRALALAGLRPADLDYVECHGTGTTLGDPIEAQALGAVMKGQRERPLLIGTVKSNLGHTQAAAGVAGLIKVVLALQHERIPRSLHCAVPSPHIPWSELPIEVATEPRDWKRNGVPRRAGVSSFGVSGTNAHVVLEEAPVGPELPGAPARPWELCVLSARSPVALQAAAARLAAALGAAPTPALADLAFSLATTRSHLEHRLALVASSVPGLREALSAAAQGQSPATVLRGRAAPRGALAFLFPGQGAQRLGMGRGLYEAFPAFQGAFDQCAELLDPQLPLPLRAVLWASPGSAEAALLDQTVFTQSALFVVGYALYALWQSFGVQPALLAGHSIGEVVAACVGGVLTLPDALTLVAARGRLMQALPPGGAMVSVAAAEAQVVAELAAFGGQVAVAAVNGPEQVVLSGAAEAVAAVTARLVALGVRSKALPVSHAFHSPLMEPMLAPLRQVAESLSYREPVVPIISTVSGRSAGGEMATAEYWVEQARAPVRFAAGVAGLGAAGAGSFVELGPRATLLGLVSAGLPGAEPLLVPSLRHGTDEATSVLEALGTLYVHGQDVPWQRLFPAGGRRVSLPTYPWQRQRYWPEPPPPVRRAHPGGHPLLGTGQPVAARAGMRLWTASLERERLPWLEDHQVRGAILWPGAGYAEMALAAGAEALAGAPVTVTELVFAEALVFGDEAVQVQVATTEEAQGRLAIQVASAVSDPARASWRVHARGRLARRAPEEAPAALDLGALREGLAPPLGADAVYAAFAERGLAYGPALRGVAEAWRGDGEVLGRVRLPAAAGSAEGYCFHPALLDACLQIVALALPEDGGALWVPVAVRSLRLWQRPAGELWCHALLHPGASSGAQATRRADVLVADASGAVVAELAGVALQQVADRAPQRQRDDWFLQVAWERAAAPEPALQPGRFLLIGDNRVARALCVALEAAGHAAIHHRGAPREAFGAVPPSAVVHLGSIDVAQALPALDERAVEAALACGCDSVLETVQALSARAYRDPPRLYLVTRGAQATGDDAIAVEQAPVLGLARVIAMEHPELRCLCVDLDPAQPAEEVAALRAELVADDGEQEVALRGGERRVARLVRQAPEAVRDGRLEPARGRPFRLEMDRAGVLDDLVLRPFPLRAPGPGEVTIAVEAAGLNFLDVLLAMGVMPNDAPGAGEGPMTLGQECAGRVVAVGAGVTGLSVGQPVLALAPAAFASHVTTSERLVLPRPPGLSAVDAAALPVAYLTAWYALDKVARLRRGERVLIHAATGGVGLAAVQWALHVGAEIYATAGSPEKRAYLEALGVTHVSDSRSDRFVTDILTWTGGEGVDVVLNSLAGDLLEKSFGLLRSHGRFVELGKRNYYANDQLGLRPFLRNLSFSLVDLRGMMLERPAWVRELFAELLGQLAAGALAPPPVEALPISRVGDAFRKMAQGQHLGKLVVTSEDPQVRLQAETRAVAVAIRGDRSYLLTGGLGGLGLSVAGWLAERGAGHLVLLGRSGVVRPEQEAAVAALAARGARVTVARGDVADPRDVARVLADIADSGMALAGVVHAAGLLDDGVLRQQTPARFRAVLAPKVLGALHLHRLTASLRLDFFVLYASAAGLLGSPGQANYAAANTFLDALAHGRRAAGLPALSIDWGAFSEVGLAAAQAQRGARLGARGMRSLAPQEGLAALERLLRSGVAQAGVVPLDLRQWVEYYPAAAGAARLARLWDEPQAERTGGAASGAPAFVARLVHADAEGQAALLEEFLRGEVARVMRLAVEAVEPGAPLASLGLDSLMGLELRNRIEAALDVRLPSTLLWTYPTVAALSRHIVKELALPGAGPPAAPAPAAPRAGGPAIEEMSPDELLDFISQSVGAAS